MPLPTAPAPWNFYRLGPTKEKELFKRRRDTYAGVVVPAHIASYFGKFCAKFIGGLQKPYFIDPMTYVFACDPAIIRRFVKDKDTGRIIRNSRGRRRKGDIRRSYLKLVDEEYGGIIQKAVKSSRSLRVTDFADQVGCDELVAKVIDFQRRKLAAVPQKYKKYEKYARGQRKDVALRDNPPMFVVPPYFPAQSPAGSGWHPINLDLARRTKTRAGGLPVFGVIFATLQTLASEGKRLIADYTKLELDGFLLWIDGFAGDQDFMTLKLVRDFIDALSKANRPTVLLYGDTFSLVLRYSGLSGFCSGICYGERRRYDQDIDIEGPLPARYYIQQLKKKMQVETELRRIPLTEHHDLVCRCDVCKRKPDPASLDDVECQEHFMLVRADEISAIRAGMPAADLAQRLKEAHDRHQGEPLFRPLGHLHSWWRILTGQ